MNIVSGFCKFFHALVAIAIAFSLIFGFQVRAYAVDVDPETTQDLREDKSVDFRIFLSSSVPKTYYINTETHRITGVREHNAEEKSDFERHRIKHPGEPISNNGHDLLINGNSFDFALSNDLRADKSIPFRDFMASDTPKEFFINSASGMVTGVSESGPENRDVVYGCNSNIDACMIGRQNYGIRGLGENFGKWTDIGQYRQYNHQGQVTLDNGYTYAGFQPGDVYSFDDMVTVVEVIII